MKDIKRLKNDLRLITKEREMMIRLITEFVDFSHPVLKEKYVQVSQGKLDFFHKKHIELDEKRDFLREAIRKLKS